MPWTPLPRPAPTHPDGYEEPVMSSRWASAVADGGPSWTVTTGDGCTNTTRRTIHATTANDPTTTPAVASDLPPAGGADRVIRRRPTHPNTTPATAAGGSTIPMA